MNDIEYMTIDQTRAAAQELLDGTTGDLTGAEAERFESLTRHANQLRERQQQRDTAARELVRRLDTSKESSHIAGQRGVEVGLAARSAGVLGPWRRTGAPADGSRHGARANALTV